MKPDDLLDYAMGQLDGPTLAAAEAELGRDPALARRADALGRALHHLLDDGDPDPPTGLADRTLAFVAEHQARPAILELAPRRVPTRWADVAVAAGLLLAGTLTLTPAIKSGRDQMNQAACAYNLRELGTNLANYALRHRHYPQVVGTAAEPDAPVGKYAGDLASEQLLPDTKALHCPCKSDCPADSLRTAPSHMDFAYNVGFIDGGQPRPITPWLESAVPLLADQPPHDGAGRVHDGNSPNHGSRGQNVLFSDLHLRWLRTRTVGPHDSDLFLNEQHLPRPGLSVRDAALIPAAFRIPAAR